MKVIIPCGGRKLAHSARAYQLYTGPYFKACLRYAMSITPLDQIYILSARYGIVPHNMPLCPYNVKMGDPGCVHRALLIKQAESFKMLNQPILVLGGKKYTDAMKPILTQASYPIVGKPMGYAMQYLKKMRGTNLYDHHYTKN